MESDEDLLGRWRGGDREAGDKLVDRYLGDVSRYLRNKVCNPDDAVDLVSQTFLACTAGKDRFRGDSSFRVYLYSIANNVLREYIRRRLKGRSEADDFESVCVGDLDPASPSSLIMDERRAQAFVDALRLIPLRDQIVLEHFYFANRSTAEIAELLGIPDATVRGRLMRARDRLRERVAQSLANTRAPGLQPSSAPTHEELQSWASEVRQYMGWNDDVPEAG